MLIVQDDERGASVRVDENGDGIFESEVNDTESFTVRLDANGGHTSIASITTSGHGKLILLPTLEREGYEFLGWYTEREGGNAVTVDTVFTADCVVYAHWSEIVPETEPVTETEQTPVETLPESTETESLPESAPTETDPETPMSTEKTEEVTEAPVEESGDDLDDSASESHFTRLTIIAVVVLLIVIAVAISVAIVRSKRSH